MKLLLIRHAIAEEREDFAKTGKDDRLRPLTDEGRKKMKQVARGLQKIAPEIDLLATSPLTRAAQTGAIVDSVYGGLKEVEIDEASPEPTPNEFLRWLRKQKAGCIAAVGHEPSISLILSWLLTGSERRIFAFRKGGACLLDFPDEVGAGTATLVWALTPAQLREASRIDFPVGLPVSAGLLSRSPEEGARLLALSFLDQAAEARPRLADPADAEALHDFRVGLRRLRSCLNAYDAYLDVPKKLARRLKRLAGSTGPGRDAEVQIEWLRGCAPHLSSHHRAGLAWLLLRLGDRKREAYDEMADEVADEFAKVEEGLRARLSVYRAEIHLDAKEDRPTLATVTAKILHRQVTELEQHLAKIEGAGDEKAAHEARISAKRVRYLLEPLVDEIPGAGPVVKRFKTLQDLLGELHDAHVLEAGLAEAVETAAAERSRKIFEFSLAEDPDGKLLRAKRHRAHESGVIALARLNRARRDRLFTNLDEEWLHGRAGGFLREVEGLGERMIAAAAPSTESAQ